MSNEIEIGEYVRTDRGIIAKMIGYDDDNNIMLDIQQILTKIESKKVKHSKKIIDLIEEGDYVNGEPIERIDKCDDEFEITTTTEYLTNYKDIISILTKEQYEQNCYKVKEE